MHRMIPKEAMVYKESKKSNELLTKLKVVRLVKLGRYTQQEVAHIFSCGRNTVGRIIRCFENCLSAEAQERLLKDSLLADEIEKLMSPMAGKSTK